MYRLLIVTENPSVKDMFAAMEGWEALGFKPPRVRASMEEAVECMQKHHIDAIALEPSFHELNAYLDEQYPDLPIFSIEADAEKQMETIKEVYRLLSRLRADDSNDHYEDAYLFKQQRERWIHTALCGVVPTVTEMERQMRLHRCPERIDVPCVLARIALPEDDSFLTDRWHYGSDRLETALRNFFGTEHNHMLLHVAVISTEEVRVLCYPSETETGLSENAAYDFIQETVEQIERYLGLSLKVLEVRRVSGLEALTAEKIAL
ncbi:MAG: hypothetical protein RSC91_02725 [Clostridia bacterium]